VQHPSPFQFRTAVQLFINDLKTTFRIEASQLLALFLVSAMALLCFEVCVLLSPMIAYIRSLRGVTSGSAYQRLCSGVKPGGTEIGLCTYAQTQGSSGTTNAKLFPEVTSPQGAAPEYMDWMSCKREALDAKVTIIKTTSSSFKAVTGIHAKFRAVL